MGRKSIMVEFDSIAFRDAIKQRQSTLSDLEAVTGVTKQALNGWLTSSKIPPRQLHNISTHFNFSTDEVSKILRKNSGQVIKFRSHRHTLVSNESEATARRLAIDFFILENIGSDYNRGSFVFRVGQSATATEVAEGILRQLGLSRGQFGLEELILSLARVNVTVIFLDFGSYFSLNNSADRNLKAFCAKRGQKFLIAIDSRMKNEDVTWVIFHELAHIACGDIDDGNDTYTEDNKIFEKFRNEVANEILTPTDLLNRSKDDLKKFLSCPLPLLPSRVEHIASELGASFVGVLLTLKKIGILTPQMQSYLWGVHKRRDKLRLSVQELIEPTSGSSLEELITAWDRKLNTENLQPFLKLHLLVRQGLIEGRISIARGAELLGIDAGEMEELGKHWSAEVSNEASH